MPTQIDPKNGFVLYRQVDSTNKTASGIVLAGSVHQSITYGIVIAASSSYLNSEGVRFVPLDMFPEGAKIAIHPRSNAVSFDLDGETVFAVHHAEILGIVT